MNEYREFWFKNNFSRDPMIQLRARDKGVSTWGFAIPNNKAIETISDSGPVLEVMAGSGYWSKLIAERFVATGSGHDVLAVDDFSWASDSCPLEFSKYHPVVKGDAVEYASRERDRSLLMIWPYMDNTANLVLKAYKGNTVFLVTEDSGGCCGTPGMFKTLGKLYEHVQDIEIPQWRGLHDYLHVWRRK